MKYQKQYLEFWQHFFNQVEDLFGYMDFEVFVRNPWANLSMLRSEYETPGLLLAYMHQRVLTSSDDLPQLEERLDLNEITLIAQKVSKTECDQGSVIIPYELH